MGRISATHRLCRSARTNDSKSQAHFSPTATRFDGVRAGGHASCPTPRASSTSCATSSGFMSIRPSRPLGVLSLARRHRETGSRGKDDPTPSSTITPSTSSRLARTPSAMDAPFHPDIDPLAQRRRGLLRDLAKRRFNRGVFRSVAACKPRSTVSSKSTISNRRPSPGPPIQTKSSPQSGAGAKCCNSIPQSARCNRYQVSSST